MIPEPVATAARKVVYHADHIEFFINKSAPGWVPLWERELDAYKLSDISESIFSTLSEEVIDSIYYFFFDLETQPVATAADIFAALRTYPKELYEARRAEFERNINELFADVIDPDEVAGESHVTEWQDVRNSRPFPF